jgi:hypothetical protein
MRFAASWTRPLMSAHSEHAALNAELVWDRNGTATALSDVYPLKAGEDTAWSPVVLLATAASMSLLNTFLALAREQRVEVLGYVAQQRPELHPDSGDVLGLAINASISVPSERDARLARDLWTLATHYAPVLQVLTCPVHAESNIIVLTEGASGADDG